MCEMSKIKMAVVTPYSRVLVMDYKYNHFTLQKYVSFVLQKLVLFPQPGHPKQHQPRSRKQRGNQLIPIYIYIYGCGPPLSTPKPLDTKSPETGYTRENTFTLPRHTQVYKGFTHVRYTGTTPKTSLPNTRVRENQRGKTKNDFT